MNKKSILRYALLEVLAAVLYVLFISVFFSQAEKIFGPEDTMLSPVVFLLLLVFSVSIMGMTIFGRSIMWYLDGQKKEAVKLLFYKLAYLFVFMVLAMIALAISR
ncbi:MAG: hypothetical protein QG642_6 [Patescibacteria group bacterium]|nr:hypothetical protein [Patescibacteria group bacterium]